jgi:hypothetical protein
MYIIYLKKYLIFYCNCEPIIYKLACNYGEFLSQLEFQIRLCKGLTHNWLSRRGPQSQISPYKMSLGFSLRQIENLCM